jgi:hypothetical protein
VADEHKEDIYLQDKVAVGVTCRVFTVMQPLKRSHPFTSW